MTLQNSMSELTLLASVRRRFSARLVDCLVAISIFFIAKHFAEAVALHVSAIRPLIKLIAECSAFFYVFIADALPNGQSLGKRLFSIATIDRNTGKSCSIAQSFTRNASMLMPIDWMWIFMESRNRLGDMHAKTIVIQVGKLKQKIRCPADIYEGRPGAAN